MNPQNLGHKVGKLLSEIDLEDVRDGILRSAQLQRRRPMVYAFSAAGLVAIGAVAALATVAFVPPLRKFLADFETGAKKNVRAITSTVSNEKNSAHAS